MTPAAPAAHIRLLEWRDHARTTSTPTSQIVAFGPAGSERIPGDDGPLQDHAPLISRLNQIKRDQMAKRQPACPAGEAVVTIAQHVHQNVNSQPAANSSTMTPMIQRKITMP